MSKTLFEELSPDATVLRNNQFGAYKNWLTRFEENPKAIIEDTLWEAFYLGPFSVMDSAQVVGQWIIAINNRGGSEAVAANKFITAFDEALAEVVRDRWGRYCAKNFDEPNSFAAGEFWRNLFTFIRGMQCEVYLEQTLSELRSRSTKARAFFQGFRGEEYLHLYEPLYEAVCIDA